MCSPRLSRILQNSSYCQKTRACLKQKASACLRLVFDGNICFEPVISGLSRSCDTDVNILGANTRNIDGVAFGQMLIQLPEDEATTAKIREYLDSKKVKYKEEGLNVD